MTTLRRIALLLGACIMAAMPAAADDFYQGKRITLVPRGTPLNGEAVAARMQALVETTTPAIAAAYERLKE